MARNKLVGNQILSKLRTCSIFLRAHDFCFMRQNILFAGEKGWLITWESFGDHAKRDDKVVLSLTRVSLESASARWSKRIPIARAKL